MEFSEPKVIELWLMAKKANFTDVELESIKVKTTGVCGGLGVGIEVIILMSAGVSCQRSKQHEGNF